MSDADHRQVALPIGVAPALERPVAARGIAGQTAGHGGTDVWLTPPELIDALGPFDLDPCAAPEPRPWPTATVHYTEAEGDGVSRPWAGTVWCNPPYGRATGRWLGRLAEHGDGIALIVVRPETAAWRDHVWPHASAVLLLGSRLAFHHHDGTRAAANSGSAHALIAYGPTAATRLTRPHPWLSGAYVHGWTVR